MTPIDITNRDKQLKQTLLEGLPEPIEYAAYNPDVHISEGYHTQITVQAVTHNQALTEVIKAINDVYKEEGV